MNMQIVTPSDVIVVSSLRLVRYNRHVGLRSVSFLGQKETTFCVQLVIKKKILPQNRQIVE